MGPWMSCLDRVTDPFSSGGRLSLRLRWLGAAETDKRKNPLLGEGGRAKP